MNNGVGKLTQDERWLEERHGGRGESEGLGADGIMVRTDIRIIEESV